MLSNDVFDQVYTLVKSEMLEEYPNLAFSRSIKTESEPSLPCLAVIQIDAFEKGKTLDGSNMNGMQSIFQIESYSDESYDEAFEIIGKAGDIMSRLGYELKTQKEASTNVWRFVARFQRVIGANELPISL